MSENICPVCGKDDQIQKVMSIVSNGIATSQFQVDGFGGRSGSSSAMTYLAGRLRPPDPPKPSKTPSVMFVFGLVGFGPTLILLSRLSTKGIDSMSGGQVFFTFALAVIDVALIVTALFLAFKDRKAKKHAKENWSQRMSMTYSQLYYCFRDDRVFDPRNGRNVSPERLIELL
jgi:hypothetical protein